MGRQKGYTMGTEHRKAISEANTNNPNLKTFKKGNIPWNKDKKCPSLSGNNNPMYGKNHSENTKIEMSKSHKGKVLSEDWKNKIGNCHLWRGGIAYEPYDSNFNKRFKNLIRKRDNQVCMNCGIHREKITRSLNIHHVDYNKELSIKENCISLCDKCHALTNFNREYWIKIFQEKLSKLYSYNYSEGGVIQLEINSGRINKYEI